VLRIQVWRDSSGDIIFGTTIHKGTYCRTILIYFFPFFPFFPFVGGLLLVGGLSSTGR
jgi:hypothetical protein